MAAFVDDIAGQPCTRRVLIQQASSPSTREHHVTREDMVAEADRVADCHTMHLTYAAAGGPARYTAILLARTADGRLVGGWGERDHLGPFQRLGVMLAPTQASG